MVLLNIVAFHRSSEGFDHFNDIAPPPYQKKSPLKILKWGGSTSLLSSVPHPLKVCNYPMFRFISSSYVYLKFCFSYLPTLIKI